MLRNAHRIEHRVGTRRGRAIANRLLLASTVLLLLGLCMLMSNRAAAQQASTSNASADDAPAVAIAMRLLDHLDAGQYTQAEAMFSADMAAAVPAAKLEELWESLPAQVGAAKGRGTPTVARQAGMRAVHVPWPFENANLVAKVAIGPDDKIIGFLVQPDAPAPAPPPPPAADAAFIERDLNIGEGQDALPGTLALPKGKGPFPGVVLVHGSGPQDRDETIGANRPFLDIARGLAEQGIAVLRYEKRSHAQPQAFVGRDFSIDDETTTDAVSAVEALRKVDDIDPARVFVLGHSQGGMMAPRIAAQIEHQSTKVAGLVLLAAPARRLLDILIEQNERLATLDDGKINDAEEAAIDTLKRQVQAIRSDTAARAEALPFGAPAAYWRSTDAVDPVAEAKQADLPMLVLQGARDIQVVDADWQLWSAAFENAPRVTLKRYEKLNHLAIAGEGKGSLEEYSQPGHVDTQLIADTAAWIKAH